MSVMGSELRRQPEEPRRRLSDELTDILAHFGERAMTLGDIVSVLRTRGYYLLLLLLALPFCTPIPLPGVSTPFGIIICLIGFRLSLRQEPYLPKRLLNKELPGRFFSKVLAASRRIVLALEYFVKPRWLFLVENKVMHHLGGFMILCCGAFLLLPIPLPFTNFFPAITIVLIAAAMLERDGVAFAAGSMFFVLTVGFFTALIWGGTEAFSAVWEYVRQWLTDRKTTGKS